MNLKERVSYNKNLFEQIATLLEVKELKLYDHYLIYKDYENNCVKIEITHFKNEKAYCDYKDKTELAIEKRKRIFEKEKCNK